MSLYDIKGWNVVMFGNSTTKVPMIYIKPDLTFKEFVKSNSYAVVCEISGTNTIYDGKKIPGVVDSSCYVPNCRPNFCEKTGYYVVTLWANWYGYPEPTSLGKVKFYGMKTSSDTKNDHKDPESPHTKSYKASTQVGMETWKLVVVVFMIVLLLVILVKLSSKKYTI